MNINPILSPEILDAIRNALVEDIGSGDATTNSIIPAEADMHGQIIAKQAGIIAGLDVAQAVYLLVDADVEFRAQADEGTDVMNRQVLALVSGRTRSLLTAERTALNFLGRISGIATLTRQFVEAVGGTHAVILDTRKTAPGLRMADKLAVKRGGGQNHRIGLYDMILIKDNHIAAVGGVGTAIERCLSQVSSRKHKLGIEVETRTLEEVQIAVKYAGINRIMLDNFSVDEMMKAVRIINRSVEVEASGNVTLSNVRLIAETGVDFISVGALTHSAKSLDISLEIASPPARSAAVS